MTVVIDLLTGAVPTVTPVTTVTLNREDTALGATPIPVPTSTGTNFSWVKSFQIEITATDGLTMTNVLFGKVTAEAITGQKLWVNTANAAYTQAVGSPTSTGDNNVTGPTLNGDVAVAVELINAPPTPYATGPFTTTAKHGNIVELVAGYDTTTAASGGAVQTPTVRWRWTEA